MNLTRRSVLISGLAASTLALPASAVERSLKAEKVFQLLPEYWRLPARERDLFRPSYRVIAKAGSLRGVQVRLQVGKRRAPLRVEADGRLAPLPTQDEIQQEASVIFDHPAGFRAGIEMDVEIVLPPMTLYPVATLIRAVAQANDGVRKIRGLAGLLAPKLNRVVFVGSRDGRILTAAAGRPLPNPSGNVVLSMDGIAQSAQVRLAAPPRMIRLEP